MRGRDGSDDVRFLHLPAPLLTDRRVDQALWEERVLQKDKFALSQATRWCSRGPDSEAR